MKDSKFNKVTILGVGLIEHHFALAMKKRGLCSHITGCGRRENNLKKAVEMKIIDSLRLTHQRHAPAPTSFYSVFLSANLQDTQQKDKTAPFKKGAIVTDVGSVKGKLVKGYGSPDA